jgi:hypothetical protein
MRRIASEWVGALVRRRPKGTRFLWVFFLRKTLRYLARRVVLLPGGAKPARLLTLAKLVVSSPRIYRASGSITKGGFVISSSTRSHSALHLLLAACAGFSALALILFDAPAAQAKPAATTWVVQSTADGSAIPGNCPGVNCTLRDAIAAAGSGDTIAFSLTLPVVITLTNGSLAIGTNITIDGPGDTNLTISGANTTQVFDVSFVTSTLNLWDIKIANGFTSGSAGPAMYNNGTANISKTIFYSNSTTFGGGGAIANTGALNIISSTFSNNSTNSGGGAIGSGSGATVTIRASNFSNNTSASQGGGALFSNGSKVSIDGSTFISNSSSGVGGALLNYFGVMTITNSSLVSNTATLSGSAVHTINGPLTITNSSVLSNTASGNAAIFIESGTVLISNTSVMTNTSAGGGGIYNNSGSLTLLNSVVVSNTATATDGGGIHNSGSATISNTSIGKNRATAGAGISNLNSLLLTNSTVYSNTATTIGGAGLYSEGDATLVNSTFIRNTTPITGGGIFAFIGLVITNTTIVSNTAASGGGIAFPSGSSSLVNTFLAGNSGGNCSGALSSNDHNLSSDNSCTASFTQPNDQTNVSNPGVGALASNGGPPQGASGLFPTLTAALLPGSPAIDAGGDVACPSTDERGAHRPIGKHCDVGAYEAGYLFLPLILK